jgi:hypothetical protein
MVRRLTLVALVGCFLIIWSTHSDKDLVVAQRSPIVTRLYTGPDGQTHAEEMNVIPMPGGGSQQSEIGKATGLRFGRSSPGVNDWHNAPRRQYVITLSGRGEVELVGGKKIPLEPGSIVLAEDLTGKGHITRNLGPEDRISLYVHLPQ